MFDYKFTPPVRDYLSRLEPGDRATILRRVLDICNNTQVDNNRTFEIEDAGTTKRIRDFGDYFIIFDVVEASGERFVAIYEIGR